MTILLTALNPEARERARNAAVAEGFELPPKAYERIIHAADKLLSQKWKNHAHADDWKCAIAGRAHVRTEADRGGLHGYAYPVNLVRIVLEEAERWHRDEGRESA